jgi:hypothetical protein
MFCPHCGEEIGEILTFCPRCGARIDDSEPAPSAGERPETPWENRKEMGAFTGLSRTLGNVLTGPSRFFRKMPVTGGLTDPLLFALIIGMAGLTFFYLWDTLLHNSMQNLMTPEMREVAGRAVPTFFSSLATVLTPFIFILGVFIASGMFHLFLLMLRGAQAGFEATFRVVCYSASPFVFMVVPYCGMPITMFWAMILAVIGFREAHRISGGKSAFAVLFPFVFCCGLAALAGLLFMGALAASFGALLNAQH